MSISNIQIEQKNQIMHNKLLSFQILSKKSRQSKQILSNLLLLPNQFNSNLNHIIHESLPRILHKQKQILQQHLNPMQQLPILILINHKLYNRKSPIHNNLLLFLLLYPFIQTLLHLTQYSLLKPINQTINQLSPLLLQLFFKLKQNRRYQIKIISIIRRYYMSLKGFEIIM